MTAPETTTGTRECPACRGTGQVPRRSPAAARARLAAAIEARDWQEDEDEAALAAAGTEAG